MTPPHSRITGNKIFAAYLLGYAFAIGALVLDIQRGGALLTLAGFATTLGLTLHLLYRMAQAMAFSPTVARLAPVPMSLSPDRQGMAA
jgi:hypothetical protein